MQGLDHRFVVKTSDPSHQILVEAFSDAVYCIYRGLKLLLLLLGDVQDPVGVPPPFSLDDVPDSFDRVQLAALWWEELVVEPRVVELLLHNPAVVDGEIIHDDDSFLKGMDLLQLLDERQEGVDGVAAQENLSKHQAVLDT